MGLQPYDHIYVVMVIDVEPLRERFSTVAPYLDERGRSGRGGGGVCCGLWWHCRGGDGNRHGAKHDRAGSEGIGAGRTIGAGSAAGGRTQTGDCQEPAPAQAGDPTLVADLEALVEPTTRGDPASPLRWTCKSVRRLAEALQQQGHQVSRTLVAELLNATGYSLQGNRKDQGGRQPPRPGRAIRPYQHPSGRCFG